MTKHANGVAYEPITSEDEYNERRAAFEAKCETGGLMPGSLRDGLTEEYTALKQYLREPVMRITDALAEGRQPMASEARQLKAHAAELNQLDAMFGRGKALQATELAHVHRMRHDGGTTKHHDRRVARMPSLTEWKGARIGSGPDGGYMVPESMVGPFHDALRAQTVVLQMNPRIVDMPTLEVVLPGLTSGTTVYTPGEASTITASQPTFNRLRLSAKKYACRTLVSSELLADSTPDAREIIAADHTRQIAARLDKDMLEGSASGITGLRNISAVTKTALGTGNGAAPTLDDVADLLYRLERDNANRARTFLLMHPRTWNVLGKIQDQQDRYQLAPDPTTAAARNLFGVPVLTSSQIGITETTGSSTDCSYIVAVDADQLTIGRRLEVGVLFDPYSESATDQVVVQTITRYDMALLQSAAAQVLTGVRT